MMYSNKHTYRIGLLFLTCIIFFSCQALFTFSPFSALQRNPENLPSEQQVAWAENALASGDTASMAEAYALIADLLESDPENAELNLLAVDLAIGGSGLADLLTSIDPETGMSSLDDALAGLNYDLLNAVNDHMAVAAAQGGAISSSQYVNAGAAIVASEANDVGGFDNVDWDAPNDNLQTAIDYAELGGIDIESYFSESEE